MILRRTKKLSRNLSLTLKLCPSHVQSDTRYMLANQDAASLVGQSRVAILIKEWADNSGRLRGG